MKKWESIVCLLIVLIIFPAICCYSNSFAQEDAKTYFEKGEEYQKGGMIDLALQNYEKAIAIDPNFSDALFNAASMYAAKAIQENDRKSYEKAIEMFERVLHLNPNDGEAYSRMAYANYGLGKVSEALKCNDKSSRLGFHGQVSEEVQKWLEPFKYKEIDLEYEPVLARSEGKIMVKIKGNPTGNNTLLRDTIRELETFEDTLQKGMFKNVMVEFIEFESGGQTHYEKWTVIYSDDNQKPYMIKFVKDPKGGTYIMISDKMDLR